MKASSLSVSFGAYLCKPAPILGVGDYLFNT